MLTRTQWRSLLRACETSTLRALSAELDSVDRRPGGRGLDGAAERLAARLHEAGADEVELQSFATGPEQRYLGWSVERRICTEQAELWLVEPSGETLLCRQSDEPGCCLGALRSTPDEGELFEVVDVGPGTRAADYRSHRLAGKVALATAEGAEAVLLEALAQRQAEGLLLATRPGARDDGRSPLRLGPPSLFGGHRPFAFRLRAAAHERLLRRLARGEVVQVRVRLRTRMETGEAPLLAGTLRGSDRSSEQVALVASLADDESALAAAALIELVRVTSELVTRGVLPPPSRSLRLLLVPGALGSAAWLQATPASGRDLRCVLQLSVATHAGPTALEVVAPPPLHPSFVPDLLAATFHAAAAAEASEDAAPEIRRRGYQVGAPVAPFLSLGASRPALWLRAQLAHPTLAETSAEGDGARGARWLLAGLAGAAYELATLTEVDLPRLLCQSQLLGAERLVTRLARCRRDRPEPEEDTEAAVAARHALWRTEHVLQEGLRQERAVLQSCATFLGGAGAFGLRLAEAQGELDQCGQALGRAVSSELAATLPAGARLSVKRRPLSPLERRASELTVVPTFDGLPAIPSLLEDARPDDQLWLAHHVDPLANQPTGELLLAWVGDGTTLLELHDRLELEHPGTELKLLWRYLEVLEGAGIVRLEPATRTTEA
ncbi:MAG: hypothetical protein IT371_21510 [Deltaproteobacteria bacterium]|nr:hypothetical protein [Deltaproteobacteria bacterium]